MLAIQQMTKPQYDTTRKPIRCRIQCCYSKFSFIKLSMLDMCQLQCNISWCCDYHAANVILQEHGQVMLDDWKLTRVSDQFRVIALGLPVPPYHGNPLDPPLRSRFQSRDIAHLPFHVCDTIY